MINFKKAYAAAYDRDKWLEKNFPEEVHWSKITQRMILSRLWPNDGNWTKWGLKLYRYTFPLSWLLYGTIYFWIFFGLIYISIEVFWAIATHNKKLKKLEENT